MPLHLLPKKSWHVASAANTARVRRDEAAAQALEEAEEQRMQAVDAERRLAQLRGHALPVAETSISTAEAASAPPSGAGREKKRRKLAGEDDTDREMRLAPTGRTDETAVRRTTSDAPLTDGRGHIDLFPANAVEKNAEVEAEKARKKREFEDQYTMRFSNAAGFKEDVKGRPWYSGRDVKEGEEVTGKDVWGNEDPGRRERERTRLEEREDPMVAVRRGVRELKRVEGQRKKRERETREREREERRRRRRDRGRGEGLEGFSLDGATRPSRRHRHGRRDDDAPRKRRHHPSRDKDRSRPGWETGVGGRYSNQFMT